MRQRILVALVAGLTVLVGLQQIQGCAASAGGAGPEAGTAVVLVSIDGFRHDDLDRADAATPTLDRLVAEGVRAERLVPVYPTKTFPNHYSLVTGLHPERHGIVGNTMRDPDRLVDGAPAAFSLSNRRAVVDPAWWGGEPIWVTAERQGVRTGAAFWPGSEAAIGGVRPSRWLVYDGAMPYAARVDSALTWLAGGARLVTLYFEGVDTAGHRHGPEAGETADAIEAVDGALARLVDGIAVQGLEDRTAVVIVSDHGMAPISPAGRIFLDDVVDLDAVDEVIWGEAAGVWPGRLDADSMAARIDALPHVRAYRREATPERWRHRNNARIPPVVVVPEAGHTVTSRAYAERYPDRPSGGAHGYDNEVPDMHGVFVASGPGVRRGTTGPLSAVDVYGVLARLLGVAPAPNDGDAEAVGRVVR